MIHIICYDVNTETREGQRRLRRIAQACCDFGQRVQKSIFECELDESLWLQLRTRLLAEFDKQHDSIRIYRLHADSAAETEHYGIGQPRDPAAPMIA